MTKILSEDVEDFRVQAVGYLALRGFQINDVKHGSDAWVIAHQTGFASQCYEQADVTDAHIVTAMKKVFPNVVFKDRYSY